MKVSLFTIAMDDLECMAKRLEAYREATNNMAFDTALHFINMAIDELKRENYKEHMNKLEQYNAISSAPT